MNKNLEQAKHRALDHARAAANKTGKSQIVMYDNKWDAKKMPDPYAIADDADRKSFERGERFTIVETISPDKD